MKATVRFTHRFVEYIPDRPEPGVLYVSVPYATVVHRCACSCGNKVVTPLSPADWKLTFDGESITLYPSVGNYSYPCRSHYWIRRNLARWVTVEASKPATPERAETPASDKPAPAAAPSAAPETGAPAARHGIARLLRGLRRR